MHIIFKKGFLNEVLIINGGVTFTFFHMGFLVSLGTSAVCVALLSGLKAVLHKCDQHGVFPQPV